METKFAEGWKNRQSAPVRVGLHVRACCPGEAGRCGADGLAAEGRHHVDVVGLQVAQDQREDAVPGQSGGHPTHCGRLPESGFPEGEHAGSGVEVFSREPAGGSPTSRQPYPPVFPIT